MSNEDFHQKYSYKGKLKNKSYPSRSSYLDFILSNRKNKVKVEFKIDSKNESMLRIEETIRHTIGSQIPILITGEIGVGKIYIAKKIHAAECQINQGKMVIINCDTVNDKKDNSEVFEKLFCDMVSSPEKIRTIILEEITSLSLFNQRYVLEMLQNISNKKAINSPRVIATSSKDIHTLVEKGLFKQDLYYRLYVLQVKLPNLRERSEDFELILRQLLSDVNKSDELHTIYPKVMDDYNDGSLLFEENIKSLKDNINKILGLSDYCSKSQDPYNHDSKIQSENDRLVSSPLWLKHIPKELTIKTIETYIILEALRNNNGNRTHTAKVLGISLRTLRNKINEYIQRGYNVTKPQKMY